MIVIPRNEESPQVTPQRESNLCRASYGDSSFGMTKNAHINFEKININ